MVIQSRVHHRHHHHILFAYRSGSFFRYPHHCEIADFRKFISITDTVTGRCSWHSANDWHQQGNEYTISWKWSGRHPGPNPVNPEIWIWIPDHFWLRLDVPWWRFALSEHSLVKLFIFLQMMNLWRVLFVVMYISLLMLTFSLYDWNWCNNSV